MSSLPFDAPHGPGSRALQVAIVCLIAFFIYQIVFARPMAYAEWQTKARLKEPDLRTTSTTLRLVRVFGKRPRVRILLNIEGRWLGPDCAAPKGWGPGYIDDRSFLLKRTPGYEDFSVEVTYNRTLLHPKERRIDVWKIDAPDPVTRVWRCSKSPYAGDTIPLK